MLQLISTLADLEVDWSNFKIFVIKEPQLNLPEGIQDALLAPLADLINSAFGTPRRHIRSHVYECNTLFLVFLPDGELVGFSSFLNLVMDNLRVLYLYGISVKPEFQARGIATKLMLLALESGKGIYTHVAMCTQNPAAYVLISKVSPDYYPRLNIQNPTVVIRIAEFIAQMHDIQTFNPDTLVGKGLYEDGLLTKEVIKYRGENPDGKAFSGLGLNPKNGDCVIVVGCLNLIGKIYFDIHEIF